jgi:copper chaperone CopZ
MVCAALGAASCRSRDVRTVLILVPEMKNSACSDIVVKAVARCAGVNASKIVVSLPKRTVTVSYDSLQTALKNIEFSIADSGFQANEVPAKPEAARNLPPECMAGEKD